MFVHVFLFKFMHVMSLFSDFQPDELKAYFKNIYSSWVYIFQACVDDVKPEMISDSVAIWDLSENEYSTNTEKRYSHSSLPHDIETFSTFSKTRPKNKVHWQASQC